MHKTCPVGKHTAYCATGKNVKYSAKKILTSSKRLSKTSMTRGELFLSDD